MKKVISKITLGFFVFILIVGFSKISTVAASGSVSLGGGGSVAVGDTVNITVSFAADVQLDGIQIGINYSSDILEYKSISGADASGGGGTIKIVDDPSSTSGSYTLVFKAINNGTASVNVIEATGATEIVVPLSMGSTSVTVSAPSTASANNSLKSLQISPGTLSPAFSSKTLSYSASVENSVTSIAVTATPEDGGAQVTGVSGAGDLKVGTNPVKISVTAENGKVATYTINVTRLAGAGNAEDPEEEEEPEETEETGETEETNIEISVNGQKLHIYNDFKDEKVPEGFEKATITYQGQEINVVKNSAGNLTLAYLVDEDDRNGAFYVYDEATDTFNEFIEVVGATNRYFLVNPDDTVVIPEGYVETTVELDGKTVKAWYLEMDGLGGFYLVYIVNWEGQKGFYQYDSIEGTFQRYIDREGAISTSVPMEGEEENADTIVDLESRLDELQKKYDKNMANRLKIISGLAVLSLVGIICIINLLFKIKSIKDDNLEDGQEYLDDDYLNYEEEPSPITQEIDREVAAAAIEEKEVVEPLNHKKGSDSIEEDDDFDFIDLDDDNE